MNKGTKRKGKKRMLGWMIPLVIVLILGVGFAVMWPKLLKEHKEAMSLPLNVADFSRLNDGTYTGVYEGGMYKWRANEAEVTVTSGKVTEITLVSSKLGEKGAAYFAPLYERVIDRQTLQVDAISGATLDSKAALQAVENALLNAAE